MIIFDTNAVRRMSPQNPRVDIIRKLRTSGHHRVAVPWMVLEELAAHQTAQYREVHEKARRAVKQLEKHTPWSDVASLEPVDIEQCMEYWRETYREIFEELPTSGEAARRGLAREAVARPPAKQTENGKRGGRDAAIWFSLLEFVENNPHEDVYFVTENSKDFGDGKNYPPPMDEDVRGLEGRLKRLVNFDAVIKTFTKEVPGEAAEATAEELLHSAAMREAIEHTAFLSMSPQDDVPAAYPGWDEENNPVSWQAWLDVPQATLLSRTGVTGHEIEQEVWYTAQVRWLLHGVAVDAGGEPVTVACEWPVKMLFSTENGQDAGDTPTLLSDPGPAVPDTATGRVLEEMRRQDAVATGGGAVSPYQAAAAWHSRAVAEQLAAAMPKLDYTVPLQRVVAQMFPPQYFAQQVARAIPSGFSQRQIDQLRKTLGDSGALAQAAAAVAARADEDGPQDEAAEEDEDGSQDGQE